MSASPLARALISSQTGHFFRSCFGLRHTHYHQRKYGSSAPGDSSLHDTRTLRDSMDTTPTDMLRADDGKGYGTIEDPTWIWRTT